MHNGACSVIPKMTHGTRKYQGWVDYSTNFLWLTTATLTTCIQLQQYNYCYLTRNMLIDYSCLKSVAIKLYAKWQKPYTYYCSVA